MGLGLGRAEDDEDARSVAAIPDARSVRSSQELDDEEDGGLGGSSELEDTSPGKELPPRLRIAKSWLKPQVAGGVVLLINTDIKLILEL